jgi:hypothetical protein
VNATRHPPPPTETQTRSTPARGVSVLYRQPGVCVTSRSLVVANRRFPIIELTDLRTGRGRRDRTTVRAVVVIAIGLAGIGASLGFAGDIDRLGPKTYLALAAAVVVPLLTAAAGHRLRPRPFELWGQYRGRMVLLFRTDKEREYGQVTRALLRAQEAARLGAFADPVASTDPWQQPGRRR